MIALPRTPTGRIALAIALSALVHAFALFTPLFRLPPGQAPLPLLTARLEPLPRIAAQPAHRKPEPEPQPAPAAPPSSQPAGSIAAEAPQAATEPESGEPDTAAAAETVQETPPEHPLPKHAQLAFVAYKGADLAIGEMRHNLEIGDDKSYILRVGMNTTGLASIFKTFESEQQSSGTLTARGLRPIRYSETKSTSGGKETLEADFSWEAKALSFSGGHSVQLPEQTQDIVSFLYQLSQLVLDKATIPMYISNGKKLERYELAVGKEEMIQTRLGRLRALPLRKIHAQGEEGLDIWLGLEYRLLPVKIRQIDRTGQIAGEMVISEIRVADE